MGQVYLAFTPGGRAVALKVIRRDIADNPEFRARFAHEVEAAQRVNGVHVAQLLDAGPDASTPWLATAYVAGPTVQEAVRLSGPLPAAAVRILIAGIAESLQAIHAAGIVHRDLKPANVVLGGDRLRVIDFGIAHVLDATVLTPNGRVIGSPHYIAPEQVLGRSASPASDVFALGALAAFAATGRLAFGEGPDIGVTFRVVSGEPDLAGCPDELREVITACLGKAAPDRPTTAELMEILGPARPPGGAEEWLPPLVVRAIRMRVAALAALAAERETPISEMVLPPRSRSRQNAAAAAAAAAEAAAWGEEDGDLGSLPGRRSRDGAVGPAAESGILSPLRSRSRSRSSDRAHAAATAPTPTTSWPPGRSSTAVALGVGLALAGAAVGAYLVAGSDEDASGRNDGLGQARGAAASGADPTGATQSSGSPGGNPSRPPGPPPPLPIQWYGVVQIGAAGVDLDAAPPVPGRGPDDTRLDVLTAATAPERSLSTGNATDLLLARWSGPIAPTPRQCDELIAAHGAARLPAVPGDVFCLKTGEGRSAVLTIRQSAPNGSGLTADGIVWALPLRPPPPTDPPPTP